MMLVSLVATHVVRPLQSFANTMLPAAAQYAHRTWTDSKSDVNLAGALRKVRCVYACGCWIPMFGNMSLEVTYRVLLLKSITGLASVQ